MAVFFMSLAEREDSISTENKIKTFAFDIGHNVTAKSIQAQESTHD